MLFIVMAVQVNLPYPVCRLGSRKERMGPPATRHLHHSVCVIHIEHGRLLEGCQGEWEGGKGDPNDTPMPSRRVGWGRVVRGRSRRPHGESSPRRRPLACGSTKDKEESAHTVPSERVSCPRALCSWMPAQWHQTRVKSWGCRRHGNRGFMGAPWRSTTGVEPDAVKAARPVLNGGDEETCGNVTRLVPTQLGFQVRLRPSVRGCARGKNPGGWPVVP